MTWKEKTPYYFFPPFSSSSSTWKQRRASASGRRVTNFNLRLHGKVCAPEPSARQTNAHSTYYFPSRGSMAACSLGRRRRRRGTTIEYSHIYESPPRVMPLPAAPSLPPLLSLRRRRLGRRPTAHRDRLLSFLPSFLSSHTHLAVYMHSVSFAEHTHRATLAACLAQNGISPKVQLFQKDKSVFCSNSALRRER